MLSVKKFCTNLVFLAIVVTKIGYANLSEPVLLLAAFTYIKEDHKPNQSFDKKKQKPGQAYPFKPDFQSALFLLRDLTLFHRRRC